MCLCGSAAVCYLLAGHAAACAAAPCVVRHEDGRVPRDDLRSWQREREREGVGVVSDWRAGERERERERVPLVEEKVRRRGDDDMMHRLECSP